MTAVLRGFELRVHGRGTTDPTDLTVDFTIPLSSIAGRIALPGPIVRPFEGRTETQSWQFEINDTSSIITSRLADANGRMHLLGRIVQVRMREDGGAWTVIGTARLANVSQSQGPGHYTIALEDERWKERNTYIFTRSDTTSLWPQGLIYPFRRFPSVAPQECLVEAVRTNVVLIEPGVEHDPLLSELEALIVEDVIDEPVISESAIAGNFRTLRANIDGTDYEVLGFETQFTNGGNLTPGPRVFRGEGSSITDGDGRLSPFWVVWPTSQPIPGASVDVRLYAPEHEPDPALPLHIGVKGTSHDYGSTNGRLHPYDALQRAYDEAGLRYSTAAMAALQADPRYPPVDFHIKEKRITAEWAEKDIYQPTLVVPFIDNEGRIAPKPVHLPTGIDPDTLFVFSASNTREPHVSWHHAARETYNILNVKYEQMRWVPREPGVSDEGERDVPTDRIEITERTLAPIEYDTISVLGPKPLDVRIEGLHRGQGRGIVGFTEDVLSPPDRLLKTATRELARNLFEVCGDGPQSGTIHGLLATGTVAGGDLAILDQDTMKNPNAATNARSGQRIVRILQRTFRDDGWDFEYLDLGPKLQPLAAPSISIAQNTGDPAHAVDITVASVPAGALATVYVALDSGLTQRIVTLTNVGNGVHTVRNLPASTTIWAAGYDHAPGRTRSVTSIPVSVATAADDPRVLSITLTVNADGTVSLAGVANTPTAGVRLYYLAHNKTESPTLPQPNSVDVQVTTGTFSNDFAASLVTGERFTVWGEAYPGFSGGAVTGTPGSVVLPATAVTDVFRKAIVTSIAPEFVGDQLWVTVYGDAETRTSGGESIIGVVGHSFPGLALPSTYDFSIDNARSGRVYTGTDIPNPGPGVTFPIAIWCRAINEGGVEGPLADAVATRVGSAAGGSGTIDAFSATEVQGGTACTTDPAQVSIDYDVNGAAGSDTVTIERYIDGVFDATIRSNSSTHDDTFTDDLPFFEDPPNLAPAHSVQYHIIVKTSGGTAYADAWSATLDFEGVVDCP